MRYLTRSQLEKLGITYPHAPMHLASYTELPSHFAEAKLVEDFELILYGTPEDLLGVGACLLSQAGDHVVGFSWLDHAENIGKTPITGDYAELLRKTVFGDSLFTDGDQGWSVAIATDGQYQYFAEASDVATADYDTWFKVDRQRYISEWQQAIEYCREHFIEK